MSQHFVPSPPGLKPPEKIFFLVLMVENSRLKPAAPWMFWGKFPVHPMTESEMNSSSCPETLPQPRRSRGNFHKEEKHPETSLGAEQAVGSREAGTGCLRAAPGTCSRPPVAVSEQMWAVCGMMKYWICFSFRDYSYQINLQVYMFSS